MDPKSVDTVVTKILSEMFVKADSKKGRERVDEGIIDKLRVLHDLCQKQEERADQSKGFEEIAEAYFAAEDICGGTKLGEAFQGVRKWLFKKCNGKSVIEMLLNSDRELESIFNLVGNIKMIGGDWLGVLKLAQQLAEPGSHERQQLELLEEVTLKVENGTATKDEMLGQLKK